MGKRPSYLPASVKTVGAMIDHRLHITWMCDRASDPHSGVVDLMAVASKRGIDFSLVDKRSRCRHPGCGGLVHFRYSDGPGTPSRRLEALREREEAALAREADRQMRMAREAYNAIARKHGRLPIP